jgi:hypothetical protein
MKIKTYILLSLFWFSRVEAHDVNSFQDVNYTFDAKKNLAAANSFHFLRSYVDYFYLLIQTNESRLKSFKYLSAYHGWCVGDAHAENFGVLMQKDQTSLFSMNDMDDFGPCPVVYDIYRLMVSSYLYNPNVNIEKIRDSYLLGLNQDIQAEQNLRPDQVKKLFEESKLRGLVPNPKKILQEQFIRTPEMSELSTSEKVQVKQILDQAGLGLSSAFEMKDIISTSKVGGGSGGLLRFEILISDEGSLIHIELKEEVRPSIYPVATSEIPDTSVRIKHALSIEQGPLASKLYSSVLLNGRHMLVRPQFYGNRGATLSGSANSEDEKLIDYEAYILGRLHTKNSQNISEYVKQIKNTSIQMLSEDTKNMAVVFETRFKEIKK